MTRILALAPWLSLIVYQAMGRAFSFRPEVMQPLSLGLAPTVWSRHLLSQGSDLEFVVGAYLLMALLDRQRRLGHPPKGEHPEL